MVEKREGQCGRVTKEEVYKILAQTHRKSKRFERAWKHLDRLGKTEVLPWQTEDQVLSDIKAELEDVMSTLKELSTEAVQHHDSKCQLADDMELKALALQSYFARIASRDWSIRRFRKNVLAGQLLTPEDACRLFDSPILRFLSVAQLRDYGIPLLYHSSKLLSSSISEECEKFEHRVSLSYTISNSEHLIDLSSNDFATIPVLIPHQPNQSSQKQSCWPGSFRYELNRLVQKLVQVFPWDCCAAAMFVCTGEPQPLNIMKGYIVNKFNNDGFAYCRIRLEIEPWVSSTLVKDTYLKLQREVLGKHPRKPALRNLAVFSFVNEQVLKLGNPPSWPQLCQLWNEQCAEIRDYWMSRVDESDAVDTPIDWTFRQESLDIRANEKKLRREYERATKALLHGYFDKDMSDDMWEFRQDKYI